LSACRALGAFVADAIFLCRAIDLYRAIAHRRAGRRGNRNPASNPSPSSRHICVAISAGRDQASGRNRIVAASRLLRTPRRAADGQAHQAHEQLQQQQVYDPGDAVPGAIRVEPGAQFSPYGAKALGLGGGLGFHVCEEYMLATQTRQG